MNVRHVRAIALGIAILSFPAGCTSSNAQRVVATVGGHPITVGDMEALVGKLDERYFGADADSTIRRRLLDDVINKVLLARAAEDAGLAKVDSIAKQIDIAHTTVLYDLLFQEAVAKKVVVSDADFKKRHDRMKDSMVVKHILVDRRSLADSIVAQLKKGATFDSLAKQYSKDTFSAASGGLLPTWTAGAMVQEFEDASYALKQGGTSAPVQSRFGWHIVRMVERRPAKNVEPLDDKMRERLKPQIEQNIRDKVLTAFLDDLRKRYEVQWTPNGVQRADVALSSYRKAIGDTMPLVGLRKVNPVAADAVTGILTKADSNFVVVRWSRDSTVTVQRILSQLAPRPSFARPAPTDTAKVREFIDQIAMGSVLLSEARRLKLDQSPEGKRALTEKREEILVTTYYNHEVERREQATEDEARAYYEAHPDMFQGKAEVNMYRITCTRKGEADSIYAIIKAGAKTIQQIGREYGANADPNTASFGYAGPTGLQQVSDDPNDVTTRAYGMDVGQVSQPLQYPPGSSQWVVFQTTGKTQPGLLPFSRVERQAQLAASVERQEKRIAALLTEFNQKYPVTRDATTLALVKIPPRATPPTPVPQGTPSGGSTK
jgi:parvulin-like peptidyl-prolyl isomerase